MYDPNIYIKSLLVVLVSYLFYYIVRKYQNKLLYKMFYTDYYKIIKEYSEKINKILEKDFQVDKDIMFKYGLDAYTAKSSKQEKIILN